MKNHETVKNLTTCALFAAVMCILGPLAVPIGPVPVSLTNLVLYLCVMVLGTKKAFLSYIVYLLLGAVGMPVFSGYAGGIAKLAGPTGGYLVGFIPMVLIAGYVMEKANRDIIVTIISMIFGTAICYALGTAWFVFQTGSTIDHALTVCVYPFIPFDIAKIVIAVLVGGKLRTALRAAKLLPED